MANYQMGIDTPRADEVVWVENSKLQEHGGEKT